MDVMAAFNIGGNIASLVLSVLAMVLSIWFFVLAKNSESETKRALEGIRTQTDALQKLAGRWLDRFTKHLIDDRPFDSSLEIVKVVSEIPEKISQYLQVNVAHVQQNRTELISCYLALQYYIGLTNVMAQNHLPALAQFDEKNDVHKLLRQVVDSSAIDCAAMEVTIGKIAASDIISNPLGHLRAIFLEHWQSDVKGSLEYYKTQ